MPADDHDPDDAAEFPIDGVLDLHTFRPAEVADLVQDYLDECNKRGITAVRIIHGKGKGTLRRTVEAALKRRSDVISARLAEPLRGGWGATLVTLRGAEPSVARREPNATLDVAPQPVPDHERSPPMQLLEVMHTYFRGERVEALAFIVPAGVAFLVLGGVALRAERGGFAWGLAVPLVLFGLVAIGTGLAVGLRTPSQAAALEQSYRDDPAAMVRVELPRMHKVNANWPIYLGTWTALVVIGLALRFGLRAEWAHGVGPALILIGAAGFLIDGFAERRARPYTAALEALAHEPAAPAARPGPLY